MWVVLVTALVSALRLLPGFQRAMSAAAPNVTDFDAAKSARRNEDAAHDYRKAT